MESALIALKIGDSKFASMIVLPIPAPAIVKLPL